MSSPTNVWIDASKSDVPVGGIGFLVYVSTVGKVDHYTLQSDPGRTNMSGEALLRGWLGSTNDVGRGAVGMGEVVRSNPSGSRLLVKRLDNDSEEVRDMLEELGYPCLAVRS